MTNPAARLPIPQCPVCGAADRSLWLRSLGFELMRCERCGHRYASEVLTSDALASGYYNEPDADIAKRSLAAKRRRFGEYRELLTRSFPTGIAGRSVLDVGCNAGELLSLFRDAGCTVAGVEASPGPASVARARLGDRIWTGEVERVLPEGERFNLITMSHVLEHIIAPTAVLRRLREALLPGGAILIEVPNAEDPLLRVWRGIYRPLCPGDHVSFFDTASLRRLVTDSGFDVLNIDSPTHAEDVFYASLLSFVDLARTRGGRRLGAGSGVEAQARYRGRFRAPLRARLDRLLRAVDPAVMSAMRVSAARHRGPVLILTARAAT